MLVRRLACLCAATALVGFASVATAEQGLPSSSMLNAMGLSGIEIMTDHQSMEIRGRGYEGYGGYHYDVPSSVAVAYGGSYAKVATYGARAGSHDGFYAKGQYKAFGVHGSIAGLVIGNKGGPKGGPDDYVAYGTNGGPKPPRNPPRQPRSKKIVAFSGGFAFAHAK